MSFLERTRQAKAKKKPPFIVIYGRHGCGKTSLVANLSDSAIVYCPKECGVEDLLSSGKLPKGYPHYRAETWEDVRGITVELANAGHKRVGFDGADAFQRLLYEHVCKEKFKSDWEAFNQWGKGVEQALHEWESWITELLAIKDAGVAPIVLAHALAIEFRDPGRDPSHMWVPDLHKSKSMGSKLDLLSPLMNAATEIGYLDFEVLVDSSDPKSKHKRAYGGRRVLDFNMTAAWEGKSRLGVGTIDLGDTPEQGASNFTEAYKNAVSGK